MTPGVWNVLPRRLEIQALPFLYDAMKMKGNMRQSPGSHLCPRIFYLLRVVSMYGWVFYSKVTFPILTTSYRMKYRTVC